MTIRIDTPIRTCLWRLDGRCFRRMKHRCAGANGNCPSPGLGKPPTILDLLDFIRGKHSIDELPKCDEVPGSPCPHLPIFDGLVLSFRGEAMLKYKKRCRQTRVLKACQLQGWTDIIQMPHWPANPLSKIVFELNKRHRRQPAPWGRENAPVRRPRTSSACRRRHTKNGILHPPPLSRKEPQRNCGRRGEQDSL